MRIRRYECCPSAPWRGMSRDNVTSLYYFGHLSLFLVIRFSWVSFFDNNFLLHWTFQIIFDILFICLISDPNSETNTVILSYPLTWCLLSFSRRAAPSLNESSIHVLFCFFTSACTSQCMVKDVVKTPIFYSRSSCHNTTAPWIIWDVCWLVSSLFTGFNSVHFLLLLVISGLVSLLLCSTLGTMVRYIIYLCIYIGSFIHRFIDLNQCVVLYCWLKFKQNPVKKNQSLPF